MNNTRRVVVVTGANEGIGHHMTVALLERGYRVAALDVATDGLGTLTDRFPALRVHACDVTSDEDVETAVGAVVGEWGRIDILVNNAAVFEFDRFLDADPADTCREFEVNYFGYARLVRAVLPHMLARDSGIVHNVSSGVAQVGHPGLSGYASTKGAVEALTRSLRLELQHTDVSVTLMYPPATNTRSAARLDYPDAAVQEPDAVGRKLAAKIESAGPAVYADWVTRVGMRLTRWVPYLVKKGTERYVEGDRPQVRAE
jgi:NAD(P)-dependent dehydrogenase (short-subunit alcohol dehydrogenase family)